MDGRVPVSVLLPTVRRTDAIDEIAAQLRPDDELLVVCDAEADPVARERARLPERCRLVVAGEPRGCSGKANAVAAGMEAARHERLVWTDDDFSHPPDWLAGLHEAYGEHGPASELPVFVGLDPLAVFLEPTSVLFGAAGLYVGDKAWAGSVIFERSDLGRGASDVEDGESAFLRDLRRTVSDDALLSEYVDVTPLRRTRRVPAGGSLRTTIERTVRFTQISYRHEPVGMGLTILAGIPVAVACLLFPVPAAILLTIFVGGVYAVFGVRRPTFLLAYPYAVVAPLVSVYALARRTFVWGGRRYRWRSKFDVEVLGPAE